MITGACGKWHAQVLCAPQSDYDREIASDRVDQHLRMFDSGRVPAGCKVPARLLISLQACKTRPSFPSDLANRSSEPFPGVPGPIDFDSRF